jgi:16S rRNA (uracil1498-N3)-methyltransferase
MTERFYVPSPIRGRTALLGPAEAHHLSRVMRIETGRQVMLFDGSGCEFVAQVLQIDRDRVQLEIIEQRRISRELNLSLSLAVALPKGDRQRWLIEKCVELGVAQVVPLRTDRGVAQPTPAALERLQRAVVEASKQCGRNQLMGITAACSLPEYLSQVPASGQRWIATPGGQPLIGNPPPHVDGGFQIAVGPEGGFSEEELDCARNLGWREIGLGPRILRTETAAIALAAWIAMSYQ